MGDEAAATTGSPELLWAAVGLLLLLTVALIPLVIFRSTRRWAGATLGILVLGQLLLLTSGVVLESYADIAPLLLAVLCMPALWSPLLLWRRTRRLGLILVGTSIIAGLALANYYAEVICSIGWVLLLLALWPCWRLMKSEARGRERVPAVPPRGVLRVRPWPACRGPETDGFTLVAVLVGIICLVIAVSVATQMIATTMAGVRRADHMAVATDLLESAREGSLLGRDTGGLASGAARLLPKGQATLTRTQAGPGLTRVTAAATWRETDGRPGTVMLEWLTPEGQR